MFLFSLIVAGSFSFGKVIAGEIDPIALIAARFTLGAILLGLILIATGKLRMSDYRQPWRFFILGGLFAIYFVLMFTALRMTTSLSTAVIFTTMPLLAAAMDHFLFGRKSPALVWGALLIGATGALWVVFDGSWAAFTSFSIGYGEAIFFAGTACHAAYAVLMRYLRKGEPIYATTFGMTVAGALVLMIPFWPRIAETDWTGVGIYVWATLFYLVVMATLATFSLLAFSSSRLPSAKVTAYTYLTPFWVVLLDSAIGRGVPEFFVLLGGIPIALALVLLFLEQS